MGVHQNALDDFIKVKEYAVLRVNTIYEIVVSENIAFTKQMNQAYNEVIIPQ